MLCINITCHCACVCTERVYAALCLCLFAIFPQTDRNVSAANEPRAILISSSILIHDVHIYKLWMHLRQRIHVQHPAFLGSMNGNIGIYNYKYLSIHIYLSQKSLILILSTFLCGNTTQHKTNYNCCEPNLNQQHLFELVWSFYWFYCCLKWIQLLMLMKLFIAYWIWSQIYE